MDEPIVAILTTSAYEGVAVDGWAEGEYPGDTFEETSLAYEPVGDRFRITILTERSTIIEISASFTVQPHVPRDHVGTDEVDARHADFLEAWALQAREPVAEVAPLFWEAVRFRSLVHVRSFSEGC